MIYFMFLTIYTRPHKLVKGHPSIHPWWPRHELPHYADDFQDCFSFESVFGSVLVHVKEFEAVHSCT